MKIEQKKQLGHLIIGVEMAVLILQKMSFDVAQEYFAMTAEQQQGAYGTNLLAESYVIEGVIINVESEMNALKGIIENEPPKPITELN